MARDSDKRNFALRTEDGTEESVFSGSTPRQAALKAARDLDDPGSSEDDAGREPIRLREKGTTKVHVYEGWAWKESPPEVDMD
ncbi:chromosomal protein MC1, partial [Halobacteriales archaeon QH_6_68_27]